MARDPLNLAFLGCGFAASLHSKTLARFKQIHCSYASRDCEKARHYNRRYAGHGAFDSYDAALESQDVDVVLIATPPAQHLDLTLRALRSGKHVIVEKPPFLHAADFDLVRKSQQASGRKVLVAENYSYKPVLPRLREILEAGLIGEPLFIYLNALKRQTAQDWRGDAELAGGGALFEGGIHWINFMASLGLSIRNVRGWRPGAPKGLDRSILVTFEFNEGPVATLSYSWETPSMFRGLRISRIYGRQGSVTFESNGLFILVRGRKKRMILPGFADIAGYRAMFHDFFNAIREGAEPRFNLELAQRDLQLVERIYATIKNAAPMEESEA